MRKIIIATSLADLIACVFTASGSMTLAFQESLILPVNTSMPAHFCPLSCADLRSAILSMSMILIIIRRVMEIIIIGEISLI